MGNHLSWPGSDRTEFGGLPPDVLIHMFEYLDPADILSVRKTCHAAYVSAESRALWLSVLHRVCKEYGIFEPTYPVQEMSVQQLAHAATAPSRFLRSLQKPARSGQPGGACLFSKNTRIVPFDVAYPPVFQVDRQPTLGRKRCPVSSVHLVPGGRFLVCDVDDGIALWDLGYSAKEPLQSTPIAALKNVRANLGAIGPTSDGKGVTVAANLYETEESFFCIYRVDPSRGYESKFELQAKLRCGNIADTPCRVHISHDTAFFWAHPYFVTWNWVQWTACKWDIGEYLDTYDDVRARNDSSSLCGAVLTIFVQVWACGYCHEEDYLVHWAFPQMEPLQGSTISEVALVENAAQLFPGSTDWRVIRMAATTAWQHEASPYRYFGVNSCKMGDRPDLHLYSLNEQEEVAEVVEEGRSVSMYGNDRTDGFQNNISSMYLVEGSLLVCSGSSDSALVATVLPMPKGATSLPAEVLPISRGLTLPKGIEDLSHLEDDHFAFCPFSGRLVYRAPAEDYYVCDYLSGPEADA